MATKNLNIDIFNINGSAFTTVAKDEFCLRGYSTSGGAEARIMTLYPRDTAYTYSGSMPCAGHITTSGTLLTFTVPTKPIIGKVTITGLTMLVREASGGYVGFVPSNTNVSGSSSAPTPTNMNSTSTSIMTNGTRVTGVTAIATSDESSSLGGFNVSITFANALKKGTTTTNVTNNIPVVVYPYITFKVNET